MKVIKETKKLVAGGPYSLAIEKNGILFVSGQIGMTREKQLVSEDVIKQFEKIIENLTDLLGEMDYNLKDIVNTKIYLADIKDFEKVNEAYSKYFSEPYPTRTTMQVGALPLKAKIEMEFMAIKN